MLGVGAVAVGEIDQKAGFNLGMLVDIFEDRTEIRSSAAGHFPFAGRIERMAVVELLNLANLRVALNTVSSYAPKEPSRPFSSEKNLGRSPTTDPLVSTATTARRHSVR